MGRLFYPLFICGGSFIGEVTISGTAATSMLWSHSEKLLDILVPLLHVIDIVHSLMCFSVRSNDEFLAPLFTFLFFFHVVYILSHMPTIPHRFWTD